MAKKTGVKVEAEAPEEPAPEEEEAAPDELGDDEEVPAEEAGDEEAPAPDEALSYASEAHPERIPVEVDVADVEPADYEGETIPPLNAESWVILDGSHPEVDDRWDGAVAGVIDWPTGVEHDPTTGDTKVFLPPDAHLTVKERSQGAMFYLPLDAFKEIHTSGRPEVVAFA